LFDHITVGRPNKVRRNIKLSAETDESLYGNIDVAGVGKSVTFRLSPRAILFDKF